MTCDPSVFVHDLVLYENHRIGRRTLLWTFAVNSARVVGQL
jgi:hypothetical protein